MPACHSLSETKMQSCWPWRTSASIKGGWESLRVSALVRQIALQGDKPSSLPTCLPFHRANSTVFSRWRVKPWGDAEFYGGLVAELGQAPLF